MLSDSGIKVWSIGSPIGKIKMADYGEEHKAKLRHICELAKIFGTDKIRMFSFFEAYDKEDKVFSALTEMRDIAEGYGIGLYHENEKEIYGDTLERVFKIMDNVKGLHYVYDPANFVDVGEDASCAIEKLYATTDYFHIKDVISDTHELVPAGHGDGCIDKLVAMISADEDKVLTLEPHLAIFQGYAQIDSTEMKNKFHFDNNNDAFDAAVKALKQILASEGYKETTGGYIK